jgi:hypothetical protein
MDNFDDAIKELSQEIAELVISKQRDYGKGNILKSPVGAELGILVRLGDKLNRLANLLENKQDPKNEPITDSWADVAGYALIALMLRRGKFELPLKS